MLRIVNILPRYPSESHLSFLNLDVKSPFQNIDNDVFLGIMHAFETSKYKVHKSFIICHSTLYHTFKGYLRVISHNLRGLATLDPASLTILIRFSRRFTPFLSLESNETSAKSFLVSKATTYSKIVVVRYHLVHKIVRRH